MNLCGTTTVFQHAGAMQLLEEAWTKKVPSVVHNISYLWDLLTQIADAADDAVRCVLDALNESGTNWADIVRRTVNQHLVSKQSLMLRLIIATGPYFDREYDFKTLIKNIPPCMNDIQGRNVEQDVFLIIQSRAAELELSRDNTQYPIRALLKRQGQSRTFLWLRIVFEYLENEPMLENASAAQIDSLVRSVPKKLDEVYKRCLQQAPIRGLRRSLFTLL